MSESKLDKGKWYHKLHQIGKRLTRSLKNRGHHTSEEDTILRSRERKLVEMLRGKARKGGV